MSDIFSEGMLRCC